MFSHSQLWTAIDRLADRNGLSPSGLAKRAGLDATAFNKSKRYSKEGRERWPSTESLSKILLVTNTDLMDFSGLLDLEKSARRLGIPSPISLIPALDGGFAETGSGGDHTTWELTHLPDGPFKGDYAVRLADNSMLPAFRQGDIVIATRAVQPKAGDRVFIRLKDQTCLVRVLVNITETSASLVTFNASTPPQLVMHEGIDLMMKISWASQ